MRVTRALTAAALVLALSLPAHADYLQLDDGRVVEGVKMKRVEDGIHLLYEHGPVVVPMDRIADVIIEGEETVWEPRTEKEREMRDKGFVPWNGRWVKPDYRQRKLQERKEERLAQMEAAKAHSEWVNRLEFDTKHFAFQSTLPPHENERYSKLLEVYFEEFSKLWKTKVPRGWGRLTVCAHRDRESFQEVGGAGGGVLAYYRFVDPRELHFYHDRRQPLATTSYMFHEANHYLTALMDERFNYPHWINEAMAEYYGAAVWDEENEEMIIGGLQLGRLAELKADVAAEKMFELEKLVSDESNDYRHYYWGWSFVHFMMESPKYAKNFRKFFSGLARARGVTRKEYGAFNMTTVSGEESLAFFKKTMKVKDLGALQDEWYAYIDGLEEGGVLGLEQAGMQAYRQGRYRFRAPRLLKEAIEAGSRNSEVFITYSRCLMMKGDGLEEALTVLVAACDVDPIDPNVWAHRGYHLIRMDRKDEGERFIKLAKEMDPDADLLDLEIERLMNELGNDE